MFCCSDQNDFVPNPTAPPGIKTLLLLLLLLLPRDAMHIAVLVIVNLSVCLSVCHTRALCPHGST